MSEEKLSNAKKQENVIKQVEEVREQFGDYIAALREKHRMEIEDAKESVVKQVEEVESKSGEYMAELRERHGVEVEEIRASRSKQFEAMANLVAQHAEMLDRMEEEKLEWEECFKNKEDELDLKRSELREAVEEQLKLREEVNELESKKSKEMAGGGLMDWVYDQFNQLAEKGGSYSREMVEEALIGDMDKCIYVWAEHGGMGVKDGSVAWVISMSGKKTELCEVSEEDDGYSDDDGG